MKQSNIGKHWTESDIQYIIRWWGNKPKCDIAKKLKRTIKSVMGMAYRLDLGPQLGTRDGVTLNVLIRELYGGSRKANEKDYKRYMSSGAPYFIVQYDKRRHYLVNLDKFWEWAEKNRNVYDLTKLEKYSLGKEPQWMLEYRREKGLERSNARWEEYAVV